MDKLKVFSEKLGAAITMNDELAACGVDGSNLVFSTSWTNYSDNWLNSGWSNYSYSWQNGGWNNYSYSWSNSGWNNYSYGWSNSGSSNSGVK